MSAGIEVARARGDDAAPHPAFAAGATLAVAAAVYWGFQPDRVGGAAMWWALGACYLPLSMAALWLLHRSDRLRPLLRYRAGDPSLGVAVAVVLLAVAWAWIAFFTPAGDPQRAWLYRVLMLGRDLKYAWAAAALLLIVCGEELVWRGLVPAALGRFSGTRRWALSTALFALAHVPSTVALADPSLGPNPLVLVAASVGGMAWGGLVARTGRIAPSIVCHWVSGYFAVRLFPFISGG